MSSPSRISRRQILELGAGVAAAAAAGRFSSACAPAGGAATAATVATSGGWATGGTAAMTAKASYPNPFAGAAARTTCVATCELTEGPCYSAQATERQDISYGHPGLPMRMAIQILDEQCKPVRGAVVDVWHVGASGKYSGNDPAHEQVAFCTANDPEYTSHLYFRGQQTTDESGVVNFDTCFPGWYASRTIHIHLTVRIGEKAYVTTQLGFDDAFADEIVGTQDLYKARGRRDTTNATDTVLPSAGVKDYLFETQRLTDGALLAYKSLVVRSSLGTKLCAPAGAGGGPGRPGGPPPGGPNRPPAGGAPGAPPTR